MNIELAAWSKWANNASKTNREVSNVSRRGEIVRALEVIYDRYCDDEASAEELSIAEAALQDFLIDRGLATEKEAGQAVEGVKRRVLKDRTKRITNH